MFGLTIIALLVNGIEVIYSFSRAMEHSLKLKEAFFNLVKERKLDELQYMITFIK